MLHGSTGAGDTMLSAINNLNQNEHDLQVGDSLLKRNNLSDRELKADAACTRLK